jgi:hypothetical protein
MDKSKLDSVKQYLQEEFADQEITDKYDFDLGAQAFKISADTGSLLLKVGENFVDDNDADQIVGMLIRWDVADLLRQHPEVGVLITSEGPESLERD